MTDHIIADFFVKCQEGLAARFVRRFFFYTKTSDKRLDLWKEMMHIIYVIGHMSEIISEKKIG